MKPRLIHGSVIGLASLLLLFSSCTKDMEDLKAKPNQEVAMLVENGECSPATGDFINLISHRQGTKPYFWRGGKYDKPATVPEANKQYFNETDFSNHQFIVVSATGGSPLHNPNSGAIGVNDAYLDPGETLVFTLSNCLLPDVVMKQFTMVLNGGVNSKGMVEMWCNGVLRDQVEYVGRDNPKTPGQGTNNFPVQYIAKQGEYCFSELIIRPTQGRVAFIGYQRNLNTDFYYESTRFFLVPRPDGN